MRKPDLIGVHGWLAWRSVFNTRLFPAYVDLWLLHLPNADPACVDHAMIVTHLRAVPGVGPAAATVLGATHEFTSLKIKKGTAPRPDVPPWKYQPIINWTHQVAGVTDRQARDIAKLCARQVMKGDVITDARYWMDALEATVSHHQGKLSSGVQA